MNKRLPQAKTDDIVEKKLNNEVLIYDLKRNKAFCLNHTLATVYSYCDGQTSFAELKDKHQFSDDIIYFALDELKKNKLLNETEIYESPFGTLSRREVVRKIGLASMVALPVIHSLIAPTAVRAASSAGVNGASCANNGQCQSGSCSGGLCCASTSTFNLEPRDQFCSQPNGVCNSLVCCSGSSTNLGNSGLCFNNSGLATCQCNPY